MCGRYVSPDERALTSFLRSLPQRNMRKLWTDARANFNVAPTQQVPAVRVHDEALEVVSLRWGLVPFFAKGVPTKYSTINATIEKIESGPSWRGPWKRGQRCILPATGFYEWHVNDDGTKTPFYVTVVDQPVFGFAGLWDRSAADDGTAIESATIITMPPNTLMAEIHNAKQRMPAILAPADAATWLEGTPDDARAALKQFPADEMLAWPVSTRVNTPKNNGPELIAKI